MKHFLRILVTLLVLASIGVACYFFFIKPDSDLKTFNSLSDTIDYRESMGVDAKLNTLISADGHGKKVVKYYKVEEFVPREGSSAKADFEYNGTSYKYVLNNDEKEVIKTEEISFYHKFKNNGMIVNPGYADILMYQDLLIRDGNVIDLKKADMRDDCDAYSYMIIERSLDEIFDYYFAYAQICDGVKNSSQKQMDKSIKEYREELKRLNEQLNNVINYQLLYDLETNGDPVLEVGTISKTSYAIEKYNYVNESNAGARAELTNRYSELVRVYRNTLMKYCDVIDNLKNIVTNYVFGGELIIETKTVKLDLALEAVRSALKTDNNESVVSERITLKLADATTFINGQFGKLTSVNSNEDDLLLTYNTVVKNAKADLVAILNLNSEQINQLAIGDADDQLKSNYNAEYLKDIIKILNIYGFGAGEVQND